MRSLLLAAVVALVFMSGRTALADDTIKNAGDHPDYHVEIEPHGDFGWYHRYAANSGFGLGARFTIPIVQNGFIPKLNNNVGVSFGIDFIHYAGCYFYDVRFGEYGCSANYLMFPVALQWNFFVAEHWSVGGEPGFYIYHAFFDDTVCTARNIDPRFCGYPTQTGVDFLFSVLGRYHFSEKASLTMRVGYPYVSIGASFFL